MSDAHKKKYTLKAIINGIHYSKRTDDVEKTLVELKPEFVLTEMYVTIKQKDALIERRMIAQHAKKFYQDPIFRQVFISNLGLV